MRKFIVIILTIICITGYAFAWESFKTVDDFTDQKAIIVRSTTEDIIESDSENAVIMITGSKTAEAIMINWDQFITKDEDIIMDVRFDKNEPFSLKIYVGGKAGFFNDPIEMNDFIKKMKIHNYVLLRVYDYNHNSLIIKIQLNGFTRKFNKYFN